MSEHTPGPWHKVPTDSRPSEFYIRCQNEKGQFEGIAKVLHPFSVNSETVKANADLLQAAPDLLEALKECVTEDGAHAWRTADTLTRRLDAINAIARAAIAKAEGTPTNPY